MSRLPVLPWRRCAAVGCPSTDRSPGPTGLCPDHLRALADGPVAVDLWRDVPWRSVPTWWDIKWTRMRHRAGFPRRSYTFDEFAAEMVRRGLVTDDAVAEVNRRAAERKATGE